METFDKERINKLSNEVNQFRTFVIDRLVKYFKDKNSEEVIEIMADWLDLDTLLELNDRANAARKIINECET